MPFYKISEMETLREGESPLAEIKRVAGELMKAGLVTYHKGHGAPPHYHPRDEQFILVLEGRRYFILGEEERVVGPGDLVHIPRNTRHGGRSLDERCVMFVVKSPAGDGRLSQDYHAAADQEAVAARLDRKAKELA